MYNVQQCNAITHPVWEPHRAFTFAANSANSSVIIFVRGVLGNRVSVVLTAQFYHRVCNVVARDKGQAHTWHAIAHSI